MAVNEGRGKRPEATEVDMEPARGGGEDLWSVQAEAEVAQGGEYPEHLVVMVNGLVGRWIRVYCYFGRLCSGFVQLWGFLVSVAKCDLFYSADDWKFAAEQFVRRMPDKVIIHREYPQSTCYAISCRVSW